MDEMLRGLPAILLLLAGTFALGRREIVGRLAAWCDGSPPRILGLAQLILVPYLFYALLLNVFSLDGFFRLLLYVNLPILVTLSGEAGSLPSWRDALALLLVWIPVDLRLLRPIWSWPPGQSGYFLYGLTGVCLAVYLFVVVRRIEGVGYTFSFRKRDLAVAVLCFLAFAPIAISIGLATGFLRLAQHPLPILPSMARVAGTFLLTGVPEELLFRGLIQNLIQRRTGRSTVSVVVSAMVFGAAHLNNGPHPDWHYFLLASFAGVTYSLAYRLGGTLAAPALTHTLVDSVWVLFFRR